MNEEEYNDCSVVAYPHEIRFLHIKGGYVSYYVDRHVSDYVDKLQKENLKLKDKLEASEKARKEAIEFMKDCEFDKTDKYIAIGEYQEYKDLLNILDIDKG